MIDLDEKGSGRAVDRPGPMATEHSVLIGPHVAATRTTLGLDVKAIARAVDRRARTASAFLVQAAQAATENAMTHGPVARAIARAMDHPALTASGRLARLAHVEVMIGPTVELAAKGIGRAVAHLDRTAIDRLVQAARAATGSATTLVRVAPMAARVTSPFVAATARAVEHRDRMPADLNSTIERPDGIARDPVKPDVVESDPSERSRPSKPSAFETPSGPASRVGAA